MGVPRLPWPARAANAVGAGVRALGVPLLALDVEDLLARARRRTGLGDFGDDRFREPLSLLVRSLEEEACLTPLGRLAARRDLDRVLEQRLRMTDVQRRHPEIADIPVERPLFVLGMPRTGTSILHELLAQDPANRVPMTWEVMEPWPPPERASYESDPRIARSERHLAGIDRLLPDFKRMHPMGAQLPQECVALTAYEFATLIHQTTHHVPSYQAWLDRANLRPVYAAHRRFLQYLAWRCPAERWALKSPGHLWALDALLAVYPDARIVQTHRDPVRVAASLISLICTLRSMASDRVVPEEIARDWTDRLAEGLRLGLQARVRAELPAERVFDLHLRAFVGCEIETIERMYAHFGLALGDEARRRMQRFLAANASDKHGVHRYRLADFGLDPRAERERFRAYVEHFDVEEEPVD